MKKLLVLFLSLVCVLSLVGCGNKVSNPNTNLEFWILDNVEDVDFSKYNEKVGLMGGRQYYGTGYNPTDVPFGYHENPEPFVLYTVTPYPDYSNKSSYITGIYITDPSVSFYGLSVNSTREDIDYILTSNGFEIKSEEENCVVYSKDDLTFTFYSDTIIIDAKVSNIWNLMID